MDEMNKCTKNSKSTNKALFCKGELMQYFGFTSCSLCHFLYFVLTLILFPSTVYAAEPATPSVGRLLLGLIFMIALIFIGAWLVRRAPQLNAQGVIKIIASTSVGTRERVVLLQVGEQQVLVGVTSASITHLQTLENKVELPTTPSLSFQETLQKMLKGQKTT